LLLVTVEQNQWFFCLSLFVVARIGWAGANIFYDAFLVDVTTPRRMDRISALGYGYGYVGSVIPFLLIIGLIFSAGMDGGLPERETRIGFAIVALWWLLLSLPAVRNIKQIHHIPPEPSAVFSSLKRVWTTCREISSYKQVFLFLAAYFFYIDGVGTIISMSTAYGRDLGFGATMLLLVLLCIQLVAFPFTIIFGRLAGSLGVKTMLYIGIAVYCLATLSGFLLAGLQSPLMRNILFWFIAFLIASSMGGIQALSRSYFARLIPAEKSAEFFGFYNIFGKFAAITGPSLMAVVASFTGETRWGLLSILVLFLTGGLLLHKVKENQEKLEE
jgi:UMF1 family MFS transporter